jgi:hypothetical protein
LEISRSGLIGVRVPQPIADGLFAVAVDEGQAALGVEINLDDDQLPNN